MLTWTLTSSYWRLPSLLPRQPQPSSERPLRPNVNLLHKAKSQSQQILWPKTANGLKVWSQPPGWWLQPHTTFVRLLMPLFKVGLNVFQTYSSKIICKNVFFSQIGIRQGTFTPLVILGLDFVSWICIKNFLKNLKLKIGIDWVNLTPCQAHWVL